MIDAIRTDADGRGHAIMQDVKPRLPFTHRYLIPKSSSPAGYSTTIKRAMYLAKEIGKPSRFCGEGRAAVVFVARITDKRLS